MLTENKHYKLQQEEFALLVSCMNTDDSGKTHMDNLLYFRIPKLIGLSEIKQCYFPNGAKEQAALASFLISATFIGGNAENGGYTTDEVRKMFQEKHEERTILA